MKRLFFLFVLVLFSLPLIISCDECNPPTTDLVVRFTCDTFSHVQRSLLPQKEDMVIISFRIQGTGPQGETVEVEASDTSVTLGNLAIGTWILTAQALNGKGVVLAQGALTTFLSQVTSSATINLTELAGEGSVSIAFTWDTEQVSDDVELTISITDQKNNSIVVREAVLDKALGIAGFNENLAAGSYRLTAKLSSQGSVVSGATEAVRIIEKTTTSGTIPMHIGDHFTTFGLTVINNTMLPISGDLRCTPENPSAGESVTLTFTPDNLGQDIRFDSLISTWYCEGEFVHTGCTYTSVPAAGSHRYDIIISHKKLGSVGSSTFLVDMPLQQ